jgi:hypothetical protein
VRLASQLTGWDIDIMSRTDEARLRTQALKKFCTIPDVDEIMAARIFDAGYTKFDELLEAGAETLSTNVDGINPEFGEKICDFLFEMDEDEYYREIEIDESEILALETATQASARQRFGELFSDLDEEDFEETAEAKPLSGRPQTTKLRPSEIFRAGEGGAPTQPLPPGAEPGAEAPAAHTFTPEWVATWKSRLPEHVDQALAGLRNRIGKRMADGEPFTSEDFESAYSAKGLSPSHYTRFHAQFEDDDAEYRDRFTAEIGALLALTGESQPDAVAAALAEISGYPYLGTAVASGPLSCARPDAFPVADWTSFALILCPAGPLGQGNPLFAVAPEIKQRIQQVTQIDVELGEGRPAIRRDAGQCRQLHRLHRDPARPEESRRELRRGQRPRHQSGVVGLRARVGEVQPRPRQLVIRAGSRPGTALRPRLRPRVRARPRNPRSPRPGSRVNRGRRSPGGVGTAVSPGDPRPAPTSIPLHQFGFGSSTKRIGSRSTSSLLPCSVTTSRRIDWFGRPQLAMIVT